MYQPQQSDSDHNQNLTLNKQMRQKQFFFFLQEISVLAFGAVEVQESFSAVRNFQVHLSDSVDKGLPW